MKGFAFSLVFFVGLCALVWLGVKLDKFDDG